MSDIITNGGNEDVVKISPELEARIVEFERSAQDTIETIGSAYSALNLNDRVIQGDVADSASVQGLKRQFILDSFKIDRFQKSLREWEILQTENFIRTEINTYNKTTGEMSRVNEKVESLNTELKTLKKSTELPAFKFSRQTLERFNPSILERISKEENGDYPSVVEIEQIYSLDPESNLPFPDFKEFNQLVNIEYKLRVERRIKYEILLLIKNQIIANNSKWSARDRDLDDFLQTKLTGVIDDVERIKAHEYEDLNLEESDDENESFEQELEEQEVEDEDNEEHEEHEENEVSDEEVDNISKRNSEAIPRERPQVQEEESDEEMLIDG